MSFSRFAAHRHLHSFPTRRSSDLNPNGTSAQENQAIRSLKGDSRAPDTVDVGPSFAIAGASEGLYKPYKVATYKTNGDRKSTRLNSSHTVISYAVFCLKKNKYNYK